MGLAASSSRGGGVALVALVPAFILALVSLIVIVMVQMARASMDSSVTSQKQLQQSNAQHQEVLMALRSYGGLQSNQRALSDIDSQSAKDSLRPAPNSDTELIRTTALGSAPGQPSQPQLSEPMVHHGATITQTGPAHFLTKGMMFKTLEEAKAYVEP